MGAPGQVWSEGQSVCGQERQPRGREGYALPEARSGQACRRMRWTAIGVSTGALSSPGRRAKAEPGSPPPIPVQLIFIIYISHHLISAHLIIMHQLVRAATFLVARGWTLRWGVVEFPAGEKGGWLNQLMGD